VCVCLCLCACARVCGAQIDNRRVFVTIARRHHALIIRALNPAAQQECELVLPGSQLKHLLPDELLQEENETEMLKHLANECVCSSLCTGSSRVW